MSPTFMPERGEVDGRRLSSGDWPGAENRNSDAACDSEPTQLPRAPGVTQSNATPAVARLGRYEISGEHARGSSSRILAGCDLRLKRQVAVKELLRRGPTVEARFRREALVIARLQHPSIVPIYD